MTHPSTLRPHEVPFYDGHAEQWWSPHGPFRHLHLMNPVRLSYVKKVLEQHGLTHASQNDTPPHEKRDQHAPLAGLVGLDVGCGGGIATEPLARMGACMTGIDTSALGIAAAKAHGAAQSLDITYTENTIEAYALDHDAPRSFDFITAFEVLEHVQEYAIFFKAVRTLLKPGGIIIFSTINRTARSYCGAILMGEYILRLLPKGTHEWQHFLKPSEVAQHMRTAGITYQDVMGMTPTLKGAWRPTSSMPINYIGYGIAG